MPFSSNNNSLFSKEGIKDLYEYRDLLFFLVKRDINAVYKQTVMGFSWALIRPFAQMVVFTLVFGKWAGIKGDGDSYAVFSFLALVPWTYFSSSATGSTGSLVSNMGIITKVYFPRLIIPLTPILAKLFDFFIAFVFIFILCFILDVSPKQEVVYFPILILLMVICSCLMSSLIESGALIVISACRRVTLAVRCAYSPFFLVTLISYCSATSCDLRYYLICVPDSSTSLP